MMEEEEAVLVEHADTGNSTDIDDDNNVPELRREKGPEPIQIVSIGINGESALTVREQAFQGLRVGISITGRSGEHS